MPLIMLQFGANSLKALEDGLRSVLPGNSPSIWILDADKARSLEYRPVPELSVGGAIAQLRDGHAASIRIQPRSGFVDWVIVYCPGFDGTGPPIWNAAVEFTAHPDDSLVVEFMKLEGIAYAALTKEETIEMSQIPDLKSFPWDDPSLIVGAVRTGETVTIRSGLSARD
jgi:hypothetical protein